MQDTLIMHGRLPVKVPIGIAIIANICESVDLHDRIVTREGWCYGPMGMVLALVLRMYGTSLSLSL
jgi:hypothetical protein